MPSYTYASKSTDPPSHSLHAFQIQVQGGNHLRWDGLGGRYLNAPSRTENPIHPPPPCRWCGSRRSPEIMICVSLSRVMITEREVIIWPDSTTDYATNFSNPTGYDTYILHQKNGFEKRHKNNDHLSYETLPCQSPRTNTNPPIPLTSPTTTKSRR